MAIIKYKNIFFTISILLIAASLFAIFFFGLDFGIDFTGGSIVEVEYVDNFPRIEDIWDRISALGLDDVSVRYSGDSRLIVRSGEITDSEHIELLRALSLGSSVELEELRFNMIGPVIGGELKKKALIALSIVIIAIILFIAFVFRNVSRTSGSEGESVSSWKYGVIAIIALAHDIIIPTGVFAALGGFFADFQIDALFVTALLAILGFSVNDTIVVFDRVRENLQKNRREHLRRSFSDTVGDSLRQTYARSLNTSLTTAFVLLALYIAGGAATAHFSLVLIIGVVAGTYSSICLASPLLVAVEAFQNRRKI